VPPEHRSVVADPAERERQVSDAQFLDQVQRVEDLGACGVGEQTE
jgi:hypothetical protein